MKKIFLLAVSLTLAFLPAPAQDDLQKQLSAAGSAKEFPGAPYLVVFEHTAVRVEESGLSHVDKEVLYKVLDVAGAKELQSLTFGYDPLSAWVEVKEMKVLRAGGALETVPLSAVRDYPAPARGIYWGRARSLFLPAAWSPATASGSRPTRRDSPTPCSVPTHRTVARRTIVMSRP